MHCGAYSESLLFAVGLHIHKLLHPPDGKKAFSSGANCVQGRTTRCSFHHVRTVLDSLLSSCRLTACYSSTAVPRLSLEGHEQRVFQGLAQRPYFCFCILKYAESIIARKLSTIEVGRRPRRTEYVCLVRSYWSMRDSHYNSISRWTLRDANTMT